MEKNLDLEDDSDEESDNNEEDTEKLSQEREVSIYGLSELPPSDDEYYYESEEELELDRFGNIIEKGTKDETTKKEDESKDAFDLKDIKSASEQIV
mgnify:CR=1 FL=1